MAGSGGGGGQRWSFPAAVALAGGLSLVGIGLWAMVAPAGFFDAMASFEPYNQHFIQDIGAFQIGLGAVLILATRLADGLAVALLGSGTGAAAHLVSHIIGRDLGGKPETDIPIFALLAAILVVAGAVRVGGRRARL